MGGMKDKNSFPNKGRLKVTFEDEGQDCTEWLLQDGKVVEANLQTWAWKDSVVVDPSITVGSQLNFEDPKGQPRTLKHRVIKVEQVSEDVHVAIPGMR